MAAVSTPALAAQAARYPWWDERWDAIDPASREAYDGWVGQVRGARAARRARLVARRVWSGRRWAGPVRRRLQAFWDLLDNDKGDAFGTAVQAAPGWLP